jgi:hypothetical protein
VDSRAGWGRQQSNSWRRLSTLERWDSLSLFWLLLKMRESPCRCYSFTRSVTTVALDGNEKIWREPICE